MRTRTELVLSTQALMLLVNSMEDSYWAVRQILNAVVGTYIVVFEREAN